ncbi:MAG: hypothetical protein C5B50_14950 [Verrucomicrobia bacterium]|nr:MAG: hypothetical protein C5B50_14950 [Verrucomicrobiota bacterium]
MALRPFPLRGQKVATEAAAAAATNALIHSLIGPDGKLNSKGRRFSTPAYNREALRLVIQEANTAAAQLHLPEKLPITEQDLTRVFISGYGMSLMWLGAIGNVHTRDYGYFVSVDHKLSFVEGAHQDQDRLEWAAHYRWPKSKLDKQVAYQLATQWLAAAQMDVIALNRDCHSRVELDSFTNSGKNSEEFVPIYEVFWESAQNREEGYGSVASVTLFSPTRTLISLRVEDSRYIKRPPLVFTNLGALLSEGKRK